MNIERSSKLLSLILRHAPQKIGLTLYANGWADVGQLLSQAAAHGHVLSREQLETIVATSDKQRFALSHDGQRIRANQGHSIASIDLELLPCAPPAVLYHGTASRFIDAIRKSGLIPGSRNHVHLCTDLATASKVGSRHGKLVVLTVRAGAMAGNGHAFYLSQNGVWLARAVPPEFIVFTEANGDHSPA